MSRRLLVAMLSVLATAACASATSQNPVDQRVAAVADGQMIKTDNAPASEHEFDAPASAVWTALEHAYTSLGIGMNVRSTSLHRIGNTQFHATGRFRGESLAQFANCGEGPTGARANSSRVYFSIITTVRAIDATHTRLSTDVNPVAVDMSGTTNARITCGSTGHMETLLYDTVAGELAAGGK